MEIYIDNFDFWNMEAMKYWSHPKSYDKKRKKEEARNMVFSGLYMGSRKMDGIWQMIIKDMDGKFHARSRTESVNGGFADKAEWIPHICNELNAIPNGTVLLGELYFPNNEGSRKVTTVFNCLKDKCLERQNKNGMLHFYIFDVLAYRGKSLINTHFEERINKYLNYELLDVLKNDHIETAEYQTGTTLWDLYGDVIANGGEGIVITRNDCAYLCGKRTARMTLKLKKELEDTIDAFIDGDYRLADKEYQGKTPESWPYWYNVKTGEKTDKNKFAEYTRGETWVPVKKTFYMGWASAISFSVMKDGKPYRIGYISGIPDSMKEEIVRAGNSLIGKVYSLSAMEIEHIDDHYSLRHGKIIEERTDKKPADCDFSQIAN